VRKGSHPIAQFDGEAAFLSNFWPWNGKVYVADHPVTYNGVHYKTAEHAFQSAKTRFPSQKRMIAAALTPGQAKRYGRRVDLREDWEDVKVSVMRTVLRSKFEVLALHEKLLATGDRLLIEGNSWGDAFWGAVSMSQMPMTSELADVTMWKLPPGPNSNLFGENHLGKLLMELREELRAEASHPHR
jgi:ribA/ribD-fused uncharacterized protein